MAVSDTHPVEIFRPDARGTKFLGLHEADSVEALVDSFTNGVLGYLLASIRTENHWHPIEGKIRL
jgi:hypothetical protein